MADEKDYEDYKLRKRVKDAEGEQFTDDVKRGPPHTSRGFATGNNEGRVERAPPKFSKGGRVKGVQHYNSKLVR